MDTPVSNKHCNLRAAAGLIARCGLFIAAIALAIGLAGGEALAQERSPKRVLVGTRPMMQTSQMKALEHHAGSKIKRSLARGRVLVMDVPPGQSAASFKSKLLMDPSVEFVEPDGMMYTTLIPDDPKYSEQDHLPQVFAPQAWDITTGSRDVVIAIVDTGTDLDHPDLAGRIFTNRGETPNNGIDDDGNGFIDDVHGWDFENDSNDPNPEPDGVDNNSDGTPDEQVSHGTLSAGLAAAMGNDGFGTAGIAWNATILPIQVFPDDGGTSVSQVIEGIQYAIDMGADIINLSIGGNYYESFTAPITQAHEKGIVVVSAAGNSGAELLDGQSTWDSPVCNDGANFGVDNFVLGVGSTDANDRRASFSNYDGSTPGTFVDCMAPGEGMFGPGYYDPSWPDFSSYFDTNTGTSFSVPLVSGLAALVLAENPGMSPSQVYQVIKAGCDDIDALNPGFAGKLGAGRINCARALGADLPPRPPRNVQAADTPGDEGGSITVTWQLSLDDGAGGDSVTEYIILRRRGESGTFTEVTRVEPGTEEYRDTTVANATPYYYLVRATDGTLTADSSIVGPVEALNDAAPPAVSGVYAEDRPADDGGAIVVGWDSYSAPDDFDHFAIYRSLSDFRSVAGRTPLVEVADASAMEYVDGTAADGVDYWYAVTAVDTFGNQVQDVSASGPVQSAANGPVQLSAGLHLFASPREPLDQDPATLLGLSPEDVKMARWSPAEQDYLRYTGPDSLPVVLGWGYWLKLDNPTEFTPVGNTAPSGSVGVQLDPGWQQVGNPYFGPTDLATATVEHQGTTMDLASADGANVMRQVLWSYDAQSGGYELIAPFFGIGDSKIPPWKGFWALVEKSATLVLSRPGTVTAQATGTMQTASVGEQVDGWFTRLCARSRGYSEDVDNFFGVSSALAEMQPLRNPPPVNSGTDLFFVNTAGERLAGRFSAIDARELEWDVVLEGTPGSRIEVWCPNPNEIPDGWAVTLEDRATGDTVDVRRGARYALTLGSAERQRPLTLRLTRTAGPLTLSSLSVVPSRAGGAQMSFTLSAPASCTVRVLNIAGRTVKVLQEARQMPAGTSQVVWDGRSDAGMAVPNGMYLMQIEAASDDGNRTQAMRSLAIRR